MTTANSLPANGNKLDLYRAVAIAEGFEEADSEEQLLAAWQLLVDTGACWQLQGRFGRTARDLIDAGLIHQSDNRDK